MSDHVCIKPSARQNRLPAGTEHLCHGCDTTWIVNEVDGERVWARLGKPEDAS